MASRLAESELDRTLDEDDQADVEEALQFVQAQWRGIGIQLHLRDGTLSKYQELEPAKATGRMVAEYLTYNYNTKKFGFPTWKKIIEAVEKPAGGNNAAEAKKIADKYSEMPSSAGVSSTTEKTAKQMGSSTQTQVPEFSVKKMKLLRWTDKDGQLKKLDLLDEISSKWHDFGVMLDITASRLNGIKSKNLGDVNQCCEDVLQDWIDKDGSSDYPASWGGMLDLLEDIKLRAVANSLRKALESVIA